MTRSLPKNERGLLVAMLKIADFIEACALANHAAGVVIREVGTASCTPETLLGALAESPA